jgi:hypothetical protein
MSAFVVAVICGFLLFLNLQILESDRRTAAIQDKRADTTEVKP